MEDPQGAIARGDRARWTGRRRVDRRVLPPGESAMLEVKSLALNKPGKRVSALVGVYVNEPGPYSFRYHLVFGQMEKGDWSGELETGRRKIAIASNTLAWGKVVNGLRAAVEFPPEKQSYLIGEKISTRIHIQNGNIGTDSYGDFGGIGAHHTASDDGNAAPANSRDTTKKDSPSAELLLQILGTFLHRQSSGNFAHRDQTG